MCSSDLADCDVAIPEIEPRLFSFNSPFGACPDCAGLGSHEHFSEELAIDPDRSLAEGAILPWKTKPYFLTKIALFAKKYGWDLTPRYGDLAPQVRNFILHGNDDRVPMVFEEKGMERTYMGRYEGLLNWLEARWQDTKLATRKEFAHCRNHWTGVYQLTWRHRFSPHWSTP